MANKMATLADIEEWLDDQITASKLMSRSLCFGERDDIDEDLSNLSHTRENEIHISGKAVRHLAYRLNKSLCVRKRYKDDVYPYDIFIIYKGYVFFALENEEEYKERGPVV